MDVAGPNARPGFDPGSACRVRTIRTATAFSSSEYRRAEPVDNAMEPGPTLALDQVRPLSGMMLTCARSIGEDGTAEHRLEPGNLARGPLVLAEPRAGL